MNVLVWLHLIFNVHRFDAIETLRKRSALSKQSCIWHVLSITVHHNSLIWQRWSHINNCEKLILFYEIFIWKLNFVAMLVKKLHRVNFIPWSTLNIAYAFSYRYVFFTLCFQFHIRSCSHRSRNECCFFGIMGFFLVCFNSNTWYVPKSYFFRLHICFKKRSLIVHKTVANWVKKIAFNATINCIS